VTAAPLRVVLAEDSVLLREGLLRLLADSGFEVVGAVGEAEAFLRAVEVEKPDLVIVDVRMPPTFTDEGVRAALVVREQFPDIAVLVLSQYVEENYATELVAGRSRGIGYLLKDRVADVGDFVESLRRVAAGGTALDPEVVSQLLSRARRRDPLERLTPRENEVLALMAEGRSNTGIARQLWLAGGTVEKHVKSILAKLDINATEDDHRRVLAVIAFLESR
jgi:DNA-binding NarL/FixJ family response regulator